MPKVRGLGNINKQIEGGSPERSLQHPFGHSTIRWSHNNSWDDNKWKTNSVDVVNIVRSRL